MPYPKLAANKRLLIKNDASYNHYIFYGDNTIVIPAAPTGVTFTDNNPSTGFLKINVNGTTAADTAAGGIDFTAFKLHIEIVSATAYTENIPTCCDTDSLNITWLNKSGGWQNWSFRRKRTKKVRIGGSSVYMTGDIMYNASVNDVYDAEEVTTELMSKQEFDAMASLRYALQAYAHNSVTDAFDIPILLDMSDFDKYDNIPFHKKMKFTFNFIYAEKIVVQNG